jgi:hypothetical protein
MSTPARKTLEQINGLAQRGWHGATMFITEDPRMPSHGFVLLGVPDNSSIIYCATTAFWKRFVDRSCGGKLEEEKRFMGRI